MRRWIMITLAKFIIGNPKTKPDCPAFIIRYKSTSSQEFTFDVLECKLHKLDKGPPTSATLTIKDALRIYEQFMVLRRLEMSSSILYKEKLINGFCHLYTGQEAVALGMKEAMRPVDTVITSYRCHCWTYLMGATVSAVLSELTGKKTGVCRGKGGSMHMYAKNFYGGNGIVGAQMPLGAGLAFAHKYKGDGGVCFCLYGDGAANQGQYFEVLNMAMLMKLPCVFICENNGYGMGTSVERHSASTEFYTRGDYVPGIAVDGMDVLASREATKYSIAHCLSGKGPIIVEMVTYRYYGHSMSDPGTSYRTRKEVQEVRHSRDPILTFKKKIIEKGLVKEDELKDIEKRVRKAVDANEKKARTDPPAEGKEFAMDIYAQNLANVRGCNPLQIFPHINLQSKA